MADTAGVSDIVFGLFWLLGYQFSPRLADIGGARLWRIDSTDYGVINNLARHKINTKLIERNWDDMFRVAGSLKLGTIVFQINNFQFTLSQQIHVVSSSRIRHLLHPPYNF